MNKHFFIIFLLVVAQIQIVFSEESPLRMPEEFSIDMVSLIDGKRRIIKYFVTKDKARIEDMVGSATVIRFDKGISYQISPDQKMCTIFRLDPDSDKPFDFSGMTWKFLADEKVNNQECEKYEVSRKKGGIHMFIWITKVNKLLIRKQNLDNIAVDYENFKMGKQDPVLYEIPKGYQIRHFEI